MRIHSCLDRFFPVALLCSVVATLQLSSCVLVAGGGAGAARRDSLGLGISRVLNLRVHGEGDEALPPVMRLPVKGRPSGGLGSDALTVRFEMQSDAPPNVLLQLVHCDRNWIPTENIFVQDPVRFQSSEFSIERSPPGVRHYDYQLAITFPSRDNRISIVHAGNYVARIIDYYDRSKIYGEGRFFAVEALAAVDFDISSDFFQSRSTEILQDGLKIRIETEPDYSIFGSQIQAVHLYRSGAWYSPIIATDETQSEKIDAGEIWVQWYPSFAGKSIAQFGNIPAGNEHRLLDLTDVLYYPTIGGILTTPLSDLPRTGFSEYDNNGVAIPRFVSLADADYVYFEFRLDLRGAKTREDIFVLGTFNNWLPTPEWQLHFDETSGFYVARGMLRRAVHEYMYLPGEWDQDSLRLRGADATLLEGNVSQSSQSFYSFIYYRETSSGGYDRIVGAGLNASGSFR